MDSRGTLKSIVHIPFSSAQPEQVVREQTEALGSVRVEMEEKNTLIRELEGKCDELAKSKVGMDALRASLEGSKSNEQQLAVLLDKKDNELKVGRPEPL